MLLDSGLPRDLGVDMGYRTASQLESDPLGRGSRGPTLAGREAWGFCIPTPKEPGLLGLGLPGPSRRNAGVPGVPRRSPATGQASLPREQEAEPRPADLLLEVRGLGRPSRPHFLQPHPTPCGPRVYGNSGLDGFSEIVRCLCPRVTSAAAKGTQARRRGTQGTGTGELEGFPRTPAGRSP